MKIAKSIGAISAMCVLFLVRPSVAQDADTVADVQCLVAIMATANQIEKVAPGTPQVAGMYFLGRIDGRDPRLDLESTIRRIAGSMTRNEIGAADIRCGKLLGARGHELETIGEHLILNPHGNGKGTGGPSHAS